MDSLQFLATAMLVLFPLCIYYLRRKMSTNIKEAPRVGGAWPIIGHLHLLAQVELPHMFFGAMADKYGPAFMIQLGMRRALVVNSADIAKECFTTNDKALATRPRSIAVEIMGYDYGMFGFAQYGPYWSELRKIVVSEFLSNRRLELLKHVRVSEILTGMKELYQSCEKQNKLLGHGAVLVELKQWFGDLTLNITVRMVCGKRYFGASAACDENETRTLQKAIKEFFRFTGAFIVSDYLPFLRWFDLGGYQKKMKSLAIELDAIVQEWLDKHKRRQTDGDKGEQDFMDVMLSLLDDGNLSDYDADTIIKATSLGLILAASDTTMVSLTWAVCLLLNNPQVMKKAQDELDIHIGKDRPVEESDIKKLLYLTAIIKETMRLYPAGPLSVPHEAIEDCTVAGYHVRAGTRLLVNIWKIQRDPLIWPSPSEFRPERFFNSNVDLRGRHFELLPFGAGRRACPGTSMALHVVSLTLARLLHEFNLSNPFECKVDMSESVGLVVGKVTPLEVLITPRLSPKFYEHYKL